MYYYCISFFVHLLVCDLFSQGSGSGETFQARQAWFDLQKQMMESNGGGGGDGAIRNNSRSFLGSLVSRSFVPSSFSSSKSRGPLTGSNLTPLGKNPLISNGNGSNVNR